MAFANMTAREKIIVAVLGVIIVGVLVGIGILLARLISDGGLDEQQTGITVPPPTEAASPVATVTLVAAPALEGMSKAAPNPVGEQPVVVTRQEGLGPIAPVIIASQPLQAGHRYRLEITATDGSKVAIHGSWSQSATSKSGQVAAPQIEFFEGVTPFRVDIAPPVSDPDLWGCSVSAAFKSANVLEQSPSLVLTIWDVTGSE